MITLLALLRNGLRSIPPALASTLHILGLVVLGAWLVVLPLIGVAHPSAYEQLIGGNYTNVTSALGACIAAGAGVHIVRQQGNHSWNLSDLRDSLAHLHMKHNTLANDVVQIATAVTAATAQQNPTPPPPGQPPAAGTVQ